MKPSFSIVKQLKLKECIGQTAASVGGSMYFESIKGLDRKALSLSWRSTIMSEETGGRM